MTTRQNDTSDEVVIVLTTFPDAEVAGQIGTSLVKSQLAACVHLSAPGLSLYQWQGEIHQDSEITALIKTTSARLDELYRSLCERHPYEVPEWLVIRPVEASAPYLSWLLRAVSAPDTPEPS